MKIYLQVVFGLLLIGCSSADKKDLLLEKSDLQAVKLNKSDVSIIPAQELISLGNKPVLRELELKGNNSVSMVVEFKDVWFESEENNYFMFEFYDEAGIDLGVNIYLYYKQNSNEISVNGYQNDSLVFVMDDKFALNQRIKLTLLVMGGYLHSFAKDSNDNKGITVAKTLPLKTDLKYINLIAKNVSVTLSNIEISSM